MLATTHRFEKNLKKMLKRGKDKEKLRVVIELLVSQRALPVKYRDHLYFSKLLKHSYNVNLFYYRMKYSQVPPWNKSCVKMLFKTL